MVSALNLQIAGCEFNFRLLCCRVTTLGKLFTPTCLCRSQWSSGSVPGNGVRGCMPLCLSQHRLWYTALGTGCTALVPLWDGKMSINFRVEKMVMADVDDSSPLADLQAKLVGLVWGLAAAWHSVCIHQMNRWTLAMASPWWQQHKQCH